MGAGLLGGCPLLVPLDDLCLQHRKSVVEIERVLNLALLNQSDLGLSYPALVPARSVLVTVHALPFQEAVQLTEYQRVVHGDAKLHVTGVTGATLGGGGEGWERRHGCERSEGERCADKRSRRSGATS